ncbi:nicotinate-nucleotide pyrophosphorylase [Sesbania bispinosa]|nr:nicotinate-nucleotide pyrophosphorylase [Sesbania bispinosa]
MGIYLCNYSYNTPLPRVSPCSVHHRARTEATCSSSRSRRSTVVPHSQVCRNRRETTAVHNSYCSRMPFASRCCYHLVRSPCYRALFGNLGPETTIVDGSKRGPRVRRRDRVWVMLR